MSKILLSAGFKAFTLCWVAVGSVFGTLTTIAQAKAAVAAAKKSNN